MLSYFERRRYERAPSANLPIILVAGPPRSGTTVVAQALIRTLPVSYFNNLTAMFPRAPITANRLWGRPFRNQSVALRSFYGRTTRMSEPNDALFLWDRWLGADRAKIQPPPSAANRRRMAQFFGAFQEAFGLPVVAKNNSLNAYASSVAEALPTAHFVCMTRDPLWLSQALLDARRMIHGSPAVAYGIDDPRRATANPDDPLQDVCGQVEFYRHLAEEQLRRIGPQRFWLVPYEEFCRHPQRLLTRVAREILGLDARDEEFARKLAPLEPSCRQRLPDAEFERLRAYWEAAGQLEARSAR
jgi:hypothetical protein